jgi:hypothetical protein
MLWLIFYHAFLPDTKSLQIPSPGEL